MSALPYSPIDDWWMVYDDGIPARMYWLGLRYGPPRPAHIIVEPCRTHDRVTFGCDRCRQFAYAQPSTQGEPT